jgi:ribosomal protein L11 methyltransferase
MCLTGLETIVPEKSWDLLDVGTGSGILAIYGAMLGASPVDAIDIDEEALEWAAWNIRLNGLEDAIRLSSKTLAECSKRYWTVTANLIFNTILELMPLFSNVVRPGGHLILSGLLREQVEFVKKELKGRGYTVSKVLEQDEWACIIAALKPNGGGV